MASAVIVNTPPIITKFIDNVDYARTLITEGNRQVRINEVLPFRVRFTTIMVPGYNSNNIPGIGLQIIGISNYIL